MKNVYFVSGIDTDAGKTYATGYIARLWQQQGMRVITQKLVQTGDDGYGYMNDVLLHQKLMATPEKNIEDLASYILPETFSYPASPHLAAKLEGREVDINKIHCATEYLGSHFDRVLLEGAGGLMVPLTKDLLTIEYIAENNYPVIFVTHARLGSINHTLLSFHAMKSYGISLAILAFNHFYDSDSEIISNDTYQYFSQYIEYHFPETVFLDIPSL